MKVILAIHRALLFKLDCRKFGDTTTLPFLCIIVCCHAFLPYCIYSYLYPSFHAIPIPFCICTFIHHFLFSPCPVTFTRPRPNMETISIPVLTFAPATETINDRRSRCSACTFGDLPSGLRHLRFYQWSDVPWDVVLWHRAVIFWNQYNHSNIST